MYKLNRWKIIIKFAQKGAGEETFTAAEMAAQPFAFARKEQLRKRTAELKFPLQNSQSF
ncbi:MAG: hypothetical protein K2I05_08135 [Mailhella sp.]|nr:hypothetical protein [Mailhella sp.]